MKERPILFSGPMVRAILAGQKTVTRRVVREKKCTTCNDVGEVHAGTEHGLTIRPCPRCDGVRRCPYGAPGDRLWVRETWRYLGDGVTLYRADIPDHLARRTTWHPSIHMRRHRSRLTLRVTDVRVERLHAIDEADAIREGVDAVSVADVPRNGTLSRRDDFAQLWEKINGKRAPWASNPWVWRVAFEVEATRGA